MEADCKATAPPAANDVNGTSTSPRIDVEANKAARSSKTQLAKTAGTLPALRQSESQVQLKPYLINTKNSRRCTGSEAERNSKQRLPAGSCFSLALVVSAHFHLNFSA